MPSLGLVSLLIAVVTVTVAMVLTVSAEDEEGSNVGNGLGNHIDWRSLDDGLAVAKQERKPLMLLIHKSWCGACKCK